MGKRKLSETHSYFVCDHTGLPLKSATCYIPLISEGGKLQKRGNYCNWESALSAVERYSAWSDDGAHERAVRHIQYILGGIVPDWTRSDVSKLEHLGGTLTPTEWHAHCCSTDRQVQAVRISAATGALDTILVSPGDAGALDLSAHFDATPSRLELERSTLKHQHRGVVVYSAQSVACESAAAAGNFAEELLHGDVVVAHVVHEDCFVTRTRYIDLTLEDYAAICAVTTSRKKRKGRAIVVKKIDDDCQVQTVEEYTEERRFLQDVFKKFEAKGSKDAHCPREVAGCAAMPPPSGKDLAAIARFRGLPFPSGGGASRELSARETACPSRA